MREVRPGVWHWQAPHPDWDEEQWWPELISSYGIELGDDFLLFDPLSVPDELRERATAVVLTAPYHERDARRLGLPVHTPPADTWQDWVEKFGVDPERVRGMESEDLAWLRSGEGEGHFHGPGAWPFGINAYAGREDNDLILWLPSIGAIVTGDSFPYHYEYVEEWLLVVDGTVAVRVPDGELALARGDLLRFPAGADGAHQIRNRAEKTARVLLFSKASVPAVSVYPDTDTIGVWPDDQTEFYFKRSTAIGRDV